jgi:hypothetical protein
MLVISFTRVSSLEPLRDLPIISLDICQTDVKDISPLTNTPLESLYLSKTAVTNLDVVLKMDKLSDISFSPELVPKEQIERLRPKENWSINCYPPKLFWEEYDKRLVTE